MSLTGGPPRLLDSLSPPDRQALVTLGTRRCVAAGAQVVREADRSKFLVLLVEGWVVVSVSTLRGGHLILAVRGPGDMVGDLSALDGLPRSATITTLEPVDVIVVPGGSFQRYLAQRPAAAAVYMCDLGSRLRAADSERCALVSASVLQRLAGRLAELADLHGERLPRGIVITPMFAQHDLAASIGATREAVAKGLRVLRERDIVRTGPRELVVVRRGLLDALALPLAPSSEREGVVAGRLSAGVDHVGHPRRPVSNVRRTGRTKVAGAVNAATARRQTGRQTAPTTIAQTVRQAGRERIGDA